MITTHVGEKCYSEADITHHLMVAGTADIDQVCTTEALCHDVQMLLENVPRFNPPTPSSVSVTEYDLANQAAWFMPDEYKDLDIAEHVLGLCKTDAELQRVGRELLLYQEFDLFNLLRYLKYLVDTMRAHNIIWGVGRGSSTASYVLYLLGVHRTNSMYYDLPIEEFLR